MWVTILGSIKVFEVQILEGIDFQIIIMQPARENTEHVSHYFIKDLERKHSQSIDDT